MNYISQTIACAKRNNGLILLFLGVVIITWIEILNNEKTLLPQLLSNPLLEGIPADDIETELHARRFVHCLLSLSMYTVGVVLDAFFLYVGQYYMNVLKNQRFGSWLKVAFYAGLIDLVYRLYLLTIQHFDLDIMMWNIKERFSLYNLINVSNPGIITNVFSPIFASINVLSISFFFLLVILVSSFFKVRFWVSIKYVICTLVLSSTVLLCLTSLIRFVNA